MNRVAEYRDGWDGHRGALVFVCLALILPGTYSCAPSGEAAAGKQPINYNHRVHVKVNEMECVECHRYAESHARATIPNIEVCADCHFDEPATESADEIELIDYVTRGEKIPWTKVYRVPSHVYFSHRRHTAIADIDCVTCHGHVEEMTESVHKQHVPMTMNWCMRCHENEGVDNDCIRCHR